jgi:hypothetical protein
MPLQMLETSLAWLALLISRARAPALRKGLE